jgi:peroxiredoxin Q/BCP
MKVGDTAPDFELSSTAGGAVRLYDVLERTPVVLFFYVKAFTPVCMAEVCSFRDASTQFETANAAVFGISSDGIALAARFAEFHRLPFPLLIDDGGKVRKLFRVPKLFGFLPGRATYIISQDRKIQHITVAGLQSDPHISESLNWLRSERKMESRATHGESSS